MKILCLLILLFFVSTNLLAQEKEQMIEITPFLRYDKYPSFQTNNNVLSNYTISINGTSFGVNALIKKEVFSKFFFRFGIGYFNHSFSDINSYNPNYGHSEQRQVNYPTTLGLTLYTNNYSYHNLSFIIGCEKKFKLSKTYNLSTGFNIANNITYSQNYHIPIDNSFLPPALKIENDYKTKNNRFFGTSFYFNISVLKSIKKVSIGPDFIIPLHDLWKQDAFFINEQNESTRSKWLNGLGFGIKISYQIN